MNHIRIKNNLNSHFSVAWELYERAFPLNERRSMNSQLKVFMNSNYHFDILIEDKEFIGFLCWWEFDNLRFIEYFATSESLRNKGYGKLILDNFIKKSQKPIVLEVELPTSAIEQRRISFYERIGFHFNNHFFEIPPMQEGLEAPKLKIMSYPNAISEKDVTDFMEHCLPIIFKD